MSDLRWSKASVMRKTVYFSFILTVTTKIAVSEPVHDFFF